MTETDSNSPLASGSSDGSTERGFYSAYAGFAKTLRTWLIAYGVGAPIIFFQSPTAWTALGANGEVRSFVYCFLVGIAVQVACAILFRTAMWYLYMGELGNIEDSKRMYRFSKWVSNAYWLELLFDAITIGLFAFATIRAVNVTVT